MVRADSKFCERLFYFRKQSKRITGDVFYISADPELAHGWTSPMHKKQKLAANGEHGAKCNQIAHNAHYVK